MPAIVYLNMNVSTGKLENLTPSSRWTVVGAADPTIGQFLRRNRLAFIALAAGCLLLFEPTAVSWVKYCLSEDDFSHCLLIPAASGAILYANRKQLSGYPAGRSLAGLGLALLSLGAFSVGYLWRLNTLQRLGLVGSLIGWPSFLLGGDLLRKQAFPFLYLFLAIPVPFVVHQNLSLALKTFATSLASGVLQVGGVPVQNEGNVLNLGGLRLDVADACSGIRSLLAVVSVAVLFAYLFRAGWGPGLLLVLFSIPVVVLANNLRIIAVVWLLHRFGLDLTEGLRHQLLGLGVFTLSLLLLYASWLFIRWFFRLPTAAALAAGRSA